MTKIPEIEETGGTGEQESTSVELVRPDQESPFQSAPITETIQGLAASKARSMGGEVAARLISGSFLQISNELSDTKSELRTTRETFDSTRDELSSCQTQVAVLNERVLTSSRGRHLRNVAIAGGTILLGVGFELNRINIETLALLVGGIGLVLILLGWFLPAPEPNQ